MSSFEEIRSNLMQKYNVSPVPQQEVKTGNEEFDRIRAELMSKYAGGNQKEEAVEPTVSQPIAAETSSLARDYARRQHSLQMYDRIGGVAPSASSVVGAVAAKPAAESALIGGATLSGKANRMIRTSQAEAQAKLSRQAYEDYVAGQEYQQYLAEQQVPYIAGQGAAMQGTSYAPGIEAMKKTTVDSRAEQAAGLKAVADYYENQARMARDSQTLEDDMEEFRSWPEEDRAALVTYVINSDRENYDPTLGPQLNGALAQASGLVNKYGLGKVRQMAESYSRWENAQNSEAIQKSAGEAGNSRPFWSSVGSVAANALGNYTGIGGFAGEMAGRTGRYSTLDPNNIGTIPGAWAGTVRQTVAGNIEGENGGMLRKAASMGYQALFSAADNLARMFMGGEFFGVQGGSLALAATGSFGQTMADASKQGAAPGEAAGLALASSFFEVLTEKVSIDNLMAQAAGGKQTLKQIIKNALKAGGVEMSEEGLSFGLNQIADNAILQGDSSVNRRIGELMVEGGMSYREAKETAAAEIMLEAGETLIVSGMSGGMMSGGTSLITNTAETISQRHQEKQEKKTMRPERQSMILEEGEVEGPSLPTVGVRVETTDRVKQKFIEQAGRLAKATGKDIVFTSDQDAGRNGWYKDHTIYVNTRSGNPLGQIVSHELTHSTEFAEAYKDLAQAVFARIEKLGADLKTLRKQKMDLYAKHGITLNSQEEVDQEIVAEFVERYLLTDAETILDVVSGNRTLGERIRNWFDRLLAKLGGEKAEERVFLENARNLWAKALEQSREVQTGEEASQQMQTAEESVPEFRETDREGNLPTMETSEDDGREATLEWARQMYDAGEWTEDEYDAFLDEYALPEEEMGVQFSYAGEKAKTADLNALKIARAMDKQGVDNETIRRQTGWFKGMDGKWRWEIDDSGMKYHKMGDAQFRKDHEGYRRYRDLERKFIDATITEEELSEMAGLRSTWSNEAPRLRQMVARGNAKLYHVLAHDALFEQYPQLRDTGIRFGDTDDAGGWWDQERNEIVLSNRYRHADPTFLESVLLHEIQHAIQDIEGFATGSNPEYWDNIQNSDRAIRENDARIAKAEREAQEALKGIPPEVAKDFWYAANMREADPEGVERLENELVEGEYADAYSDYSWAIWTLQDLMEQDNPKRTAKDLYRNTAGEIEARDAASRMDLTAEQRKKMPPNLGSENTVFAERGTAWSKGPTDSETTSIKEQLMQFQNALNQMDPVANATVPTELKDKRTAFNWALELLKPTGYRVERQGFGRIWFEKDDINYGLNYADTPEEKAALALLPTILKRGIEIGRHGNHKQRQKETVTFAAPSIVNGTRVNIAAVVTVRNGRYYTHRIVLPDGRNFKFGVQKNSDATREPLRGVPDSGSLAEATSVASANSLSNPEPDVKRFSISERVDDRTVGELQAELYELKRQRDSVLAENPDYRSAQEMRRNTTTMKDRVAATRALRVAEANAGVSAIDQRMTAIRERIEELNNRDRMQHRQDQEKYSGTKTVGYSQKPDTRLRTLDQDYMKAVKAGDRKLMQRLVDEAAEAAMPDSVVRDKNGKLLKTYHHTGSRFTVFDRGMARTGNEMDGFFFALDPSTTDEFGPVVVEAYLNITNLAYDPYLDRKYDDSGTLLREKLAYQGYDGVARTENGEIYEYMAFDPEQIKSAAPVVYDDRGNLIPLSERFNFKEKDIRYSISEGATQNSEQAEEQREAKTAEQIREEMPAKARAHLQGAERKLMKLLTDVLTVNKFQNREELQKIVREIADTFLTEGRVSDQQMDFLFDRAYAGGIVEDATFYNQYKAIKDHLRTTGVTLSRQDQSDIPDFQNFRKHAYGTVKIVNQGGLPVDSAYHELTGMAPNLFPESITHPADQLVRMYEVARSIQVSEVSLQHQWGQMAEEYRGWARHDFGEKVGEVIQDLRSVKAVAEEAEAKRNAKSDVPQTPAEAKEVYKELKQARKTYEKVRAKTLLTERDEQQVGRLLRGEILTGDLNPEENNIRAVTAVYEAKKEYERLSKLIAEYKKHVRAQRQEKADRFLQNAMNWKDKAVGIAYSRETMERNIYDIVPDRAEAETIIREYFSPVHEAEANATRFKNQLRDRIRKLNLSRKVQKGNLVSEAHAVQLLGEAEDNIRVMQASRGRMKQRDGKTLQEWQAVVDSLWKENPGLDQGKIRTAVAEFRGIYDMLFEQMNEVRVRNGYEPVNYRQGYFPHFQPGDGDGVLSHFGKVLGIDTQVAALPTSINGLTHTFKPGIQWFGNAQERLGFNTAYDAVEGFDKYLEGVASVIFQTDNIQNLRALESRIRYRTTDDGIRQQVDAVNVDDRLTEEEKRIKISDIYEHGRYTLSNFVTELTEYTNLLANKKSRLDRTMEGLMGRRAYTIMKAWESRGGANMIAGNISSALTNFIPLTQAGAQLGSGSMLKGMWNTLKGMKADDGIPGMSTFLTNRRGSDPLVKVWESDYGFTEMMADTFLPKKLTGTKAYHGAKSGIKKIYAPIKPAVGWTSEKANFLMDLVDGFTSESILRAAYIRNLNAGLSESEALYQADIFASSVMADRSKGAMPTLFESTNPIFKMFTQFQLEVNNQYSEIFKDLPRRFREKGVLALTLVYFKYFLGAFLFNELYEFFAGRRSALDPIGILNDTVGDLTGYELPNMVEWMTGGDVSFQTEKKGLAEAGTNLASTALGELPFSSGLTMLGIETDGGRIPASSAVPDLTALWQAATEEDWSSEKRWKEVSDELWKLAYIVPPFGGNQVQKIWKGIKAWIEGGSYSVDKDGNDILQYPVYKQTTEEKFWNLVRAAFLGKSSLPEAQDWVESGFDSLGAKQTAVYQELLEMGAEERETFELLRGLEGLSELKGLEKKQAEAKLLNSAVMTDEEKTVIVGYLLGTDMLTEAGNPTQYAKFLIATDRGLSVDEYMDLRGVGIDIEKFLEATDAGSTVEDAVSLVKAMAELEPEAGADEVSDLQKWRLCIDSFGSEAGQMSALCGYMTQTQFEKVQRAYSMGVKPDTYISMRELLPRFDADGNGSLTNKEVKSAIDTMKISNDQKAVLWQLATGSTSAKNNPYSPEIGQEVLDAKR